MSLRIDFTEVAATQFYLVPHDVYAKIRSELVSRAAEHQLAERAGLPTFLRIDGFEVKYELGQSAQHIRVMTITRMRSASSALSLENLLLSP